MNARAMHPDGPVVLAAGGTGGHLFPAQALAAELQRRGYRLALVTDRRADAFGGALGHAELHHIHAAGISGRSLTARAGAVVRLAMGLFQARKLLKDIAPSAAVGFGSYPSVPTMLAATHLGVPSIIHEQNAILGRANRLLASRVTRIATAFRSVVNLREADRDRAAWTGNPVRPEIVALRDRPRPNLAADGPVTLLVTGGSQGAAVFGEVVPVAIAALPESLRRRLRIMQQCRPEHLKPARATYDAAGIEAEIAPFFDDMPERLAAAHLMICRAGASTIAELTAAGVPAILVPYPHAIDDHQTANAEGLCDAGAGWMIPQDCFTPAALAARLISLLGLPQTIATAAQCAARIGAPEAAMRLADLVADVVAGSNGHDMREAAQ